MCCIVYSTGGSSVCCIIHNKGHYMCCIVYSTGGCSVCCIMHNKGHYMYAVPITGYIVTSKKASNLNYFFYAVHLVCQLYTVFHVLMRFGVSAVIIVCG